MHGFAADVVRPAAHEWDEREQTPWPIIQEAAKIGLYGFEGLAQFFADPTGLTLPIVNEGSSGATPESFKEFKDMDNWDRGTPLSAAYSGTGMYKKLMEWLKNGW